ncbi:hypothetical protein M3J09_007864 [Ascochyta lentis]
MVLMMMVVVSCMGRLDNATRTHRLADLPRCADDLSLAMMQPRCMGLHRYRRSNWQYLKDSLDRASSSRIPLHMFAVLSCPVLSCPVLSCSVLPYLPYLPVFCLARSQTSSIGEPLHGICTCAQRAVQHEAVGPRSGESNPRHRRRLPLQGCQASAALLVYPSRLPPVEQ